MSECRKCIDLHDGFMHKLTDERGKRRGHSQHILRLLDDMANVIADGVVDDFARELIAERIIDIAKIASKEAI